EVAIARDRDADYLVALAGRDDVRDISLIVAGVPGREVDQHVEVALILKVIAEIADAAHEKVAIDRLLVEDRHVFLEVAARDLGAGGGDADLRSAVGLDRNAQPVHVGQILAVGDIDVGGEAVLLIVLVANALDAALRVLLGGRPPSEE